MAGTTLAPWERLIALATIGVARQTEELGGLLPNAEIKLPEGSSEQTVLRSAAATLVWRLAGDRVASNDAPPSAARAPAIGRVVSEAAVRRLALMLVDEPKMFGQEWFERARAAGAVLPAHWVAVIFEAVAPAARAAFADVFGERLTWLAAIDPRWRAQSSTADPSDADWSTGSLEVRIEMLRRLRASDPARARGWLESTWATDPPESREKFIQILGIGLHSRDEGFLEAALDDKRKSVRAVAAEYLARLPESDYGRRARARLAALFVLERKSSGLLARFGNRKLRVELPAALDMPASRDLVDTKPPAHQKIGERAFWLMQWLAIVPPRAWCRDFECAPAELLGAALETDYGDEILSALSAASIRHPDPEFIDALCARWRQYSAKADGRVIAEDSLSRLIQALPIAERSGQLLKQISAFQDEGSGDAAYGLLNRLDIPWSVEVTVSAFRVLEARVANQASSPAWPRQMLDGWARRVDALTAARLLTPLLERTADESPWHQSLARLQELLEFRLEMYKELLP